MLPYRWDRPRQFAASGEEEDSFLLLESCRRAIEALLRGQGLAGQAGGPLHRSWISHPYGEEEITLLEEEVLPVIAACMERVREIDGRRIADQADGAG